ncbi:unnamed protein product [Caenorhabditis auriculariae]|uniref:N-acetyltransferase domain-containing protein n=1 Tax=Caenorhabditis auriculariae TaxID=2777116 RepID=A0A8S1HSF0_9PELO|nr:unnamed protein product [Caenorhabditis auriculariae]
MDVEPQKKRRLTDFFQPRSPKKKRLSESSGLKCPKEKIFDDVGSPKMFAARPKMPKLFVAAGDLKQRTLDAGQNVIGTVLCHECGMVYSVDCVKDRMHHDEFHNRLTDTKMLRISPQKYTSWLGKCAHLIDGRITIFRLDRHTNSALKAFLENIIETIVDEDIGYCGNELLWAPGRTVFACVNETFVQKSPLRILVSVLVTDRLVRAKIEGGKEEIKATREDRPIIGVDRIWTHSTARRKGLAAKMLRAACGRDAKMFPLTGGTLLRVAFSDLTANGRDFANDFEKNYLQNEDNNQEAEILKKGLLTYSDEDVSRASPVKIH